MTAENQDIEVYEREDKTIDPSPLTDGSGSNVDISGADLEWEVFDSSGTTQLTKNNTGGGGVSITNGSNGEWEIDLNASDTDGWATAYYEHEARLTDSSGETSVVMRGDFTVLDSATN